MFYEYMWQKFFMTGSILDYIIFREVESDIAKCSQEEEPKVTAMV